MSFIKVRFTSVSRGSTAGLVFEADQLYRMRLDQLSRRFPISETNKLKRVQLSPEYDTWQQAFEHEFKEGE